ncbi:MAG: hypothetical protein QXU64_05180 [Thermofilaceae archaeon]
MGKSIGVRIDERVWEEFKRYVLEKHGKLHTVLGMEVTEALRAYLRTHAQTAGGARPPAQQPPAQSPQSEPPRAPERSPRPVNGSTSRTMRNLREIVRRILSESTKEIPQPLVERIITEVAGGDWRTLSRYMRGLQELNVLAPSRRICGSEKVIFEVNLVEAEKLVGVHQGR